ncbi:MAG: DUF2335 domain-containing protein [Bacillota bacterium]
MTQQEMHIGPLPHPAVFAQYAQVIPDSPERMLKVFEEDSKHTRDMQIRALEAEVSKDKRGQWMAFLIIIATVGLTAFAFYLGTGIGGVLAGLATLILAASSFFGKSNEKNKK